MREPLRRPKERLHPFDRCVFCNLSRDEAELKETVVKETYAPALCCVDTIGCVARTSARRKAERAGVTPAEDVA